MVTTRALQKRFVQASKCTVAMDGGFKFNSAGWPLHVLGCINPAGNFSLCGIDLSSTMEKGEIMNMVSGFARQKARLTQCSVNKDYAMSDAELAYRESLAACFSSKNLMCFFHVKQAARESLQSRLRGHLCVFPALIVGV